MSDHPPYYILYSQSNTLGHPLIQYHYADDSPLSLLPLDDEQVLLLDFNQPSTITAKSISKNIATAALNLAEAPGAALEDDSKNSTMYILETATITDEKPAVSQSPQATLAQFKQRNALLRRVLLYGN